MAVTGRPRKDSGRIKGNSSGDLLEVCSVADAKVTLHRLVPHVKDTRPTSFHQRSYHPLQDGMICRKSSGPLGRRTCGIACMFPDPPQQCSRPKIFLLRRVAQAARTVVLFPDIGKATKKRRAQNTSKTYGAEVLYWHECWSCPSHASITELIFGVTQSYHPTLCGGCCDRSEFHDSSVPTDKIL